MKNRNIQFKPTLGLLIPVLLVCFALPPGAHAVLPPPDGGYAGNNTAEGQNALLSLDVTTGTNNTAVGWFSLKSNVEGDFNTALGSATLFKNTASRNTAIGGAAMFSNDGGESNTAVGMLALFNNISGDSNTAIGDTALFSNTIGSQNTAVGTYALSSNVGVGEIFGSSNTAVGDHALADNIGGARQTAVGSGALDSVTGGLHNTALGYAAGASLTTGQGNLYLGANQDGVANESNTTYIRNVYASQATTRAVYVNQDNKIGTLSSSQRYKEEIKLMDKASEALFALKPVTFRYKKEIDPARSLSFGLIAEEVAQTSPDLITRDREGKPETVRYEAINAMLLNEFLKEHRKNEEQQATIAQLKSGMEALTAMVKKQAAQIQKVSAQLEVSRSAPQTVLNNQ